MEGLLTLIEQLQKRVADLEEQVVKLRSLVVNPVIYQPYYPNYSPLVVSPPCTPLPWVVPQGPYCQVSGGSVGVEGSQVWNQDQSGGV